MASKRKVLVFHGWVGLSDDKLLLMSDSAYYDGVEHGEFFATRAAARRCYEDVRRCKIIVGDKP